MPSSLSAAGLANRWDLDPRAKPGTYRMRTADGVFTNYTLAHIGYLNPTEDMVLAIQSMGFLNRRINVLKIWTAELTAANSALTAPRALDHIIDQFGTEWIIQMPKGRAFNTLWQCLCIEAVG